MKNLEHILVAFYAVFMGVLIALLVKNESSVVFLVAIPVLAVFIFNFTIRKKLTFKSY